MRLLGYCGYGMNSVSFEKVSYGGRVLRNASAMIAEREALRLGIEHLTVLFPTEVSSFDFQVECTDRTVQYKLNAQSLRLFGLHRDVNDAHRAGANRLQNKQTNNVAPRCQEDLAGAVWLLRALAAGKSLDAWRSRSRPSRPSFLGQNGVACSSALCCKMH